MTTMLAKYEAARNALAQARKVDEVIHIRDVSAAMQAYAKQAKDKQLETDAVEIRMRAERRLGEMIKAQKEGPGLNKGEAGRFTGGTAEEPPVNKPTLADVGIDKKLSSRAQAIASIPEDEFEATLADHREEQKIVTAKTMEKLSRKGKEAQQKRQTYEVSHAEQFCDFAIRQLERIRDDDPRAIQELERVISWIRDRERRYEAANQRNA